MGIMGKLSPYEILKRVEREGFERVWQGSAQYLPKPTRRIDFAAVKPSSPHPLPDLMQRMRLSFLKLGFMEVSNPIIVDEAEVYKQYGSEASVILDRCYYLATLPRPEIGLSKANCEEMKKRGVQLTKSKTVALKKVLRDYKKGRIDSDDFVEKIASSLNVSDSMATIILSEVFPEFAKLKPEPSSLTLRSHMTSSWFLTLQALQHKLELPIKLFSVGVRFRREQREDALHLRAHHAASCVVMDEEVDVRDGEEIMKACLEPLGFSSFRFEQKKTTSKYYAPQTEYEDFLFHPKKKEWIEIADHGLYSPIALARYDLEYPVLNLGIGIERVAMAMHNETDMRRLIHPQFYVETHLSDIEIAQMIKVDVEPQTELGLKVLKGIEFTGDKHAATSGPCEFLAYQEKLRERILRVYLYTPDVGAKLLGSAALNNIYVADGNVLGVREEKIEGTDILSRSALKKSANSGISYLHAVASLAAAKIEEAISSGIKNFEIRIKMAKRPSDVNIKIDEVARFYITSNKKRIKLGGPIFIGVRAEIVDDNLP